MKDQIKEILSKERISSSQFADRIGVQRSSVSHVLSGRNKPGFDFIHKTLLAFPEINGEWLITGSGDMYKEKSPSVGLFEPSVQAETPEVKRKDEKAGAPEPEDRKAAGKAEIPTKRSIEKVIVLFTDNTFREYSAEN